MPLLQIKRHFQITLPAKFRESLGLKEGDIVDAELRDNVIVLKAKVLLDKRVRSPKAAAWEKGLIEEGIKHPITMTEEEITASAKETRRELYKEKYGR